MGLFGRRQGKDARLIAFGDFHRRRRLGARRVEVQQELLTLGRGVVEPVDALVLGWERAQPHYAVAAEAHG